MRERVTRVLEQEKKIKTDGQVDRRQTVRKAEWQTDRRKNTGRQTENSLLFFLKVKILIQYPMCCVILEIKYC